MKRAEAMAVDAVPAFELANQWFEVVAKLFVAPGDELVVDIGVGRRLPRPSWNFGDDDPGVIVTQ
jgi:hypothetical protein